MIKYIIVVATLFYTSLVLAENNCVELFETQNKIEDTIKSLAELKINLDTAKAKGTNSVELTLLNGNFKKKYLEFYKYVRKNDLMSKEQFIDRMKQEIFALQNMNSSEIIEAKKEESRTRNEHKAVIDSLVDDGSRIVMHRIEPGEFLMGYVNKPTELTKAFEMQATQMTQSAWGKVVNLAKDKLGSEYQALKADPSFFKGYTRPVEKVSYDDVKLWIKALNDLSQAKEPLLKKFIPQHKDGDIYRLPTDAEWEFVVRGRGKLNKNFYFGNDKSKRKTHAWLQANSKGETHPVALLKPLIIDGKEFYDLHGNVAEWVSDYFYDSILGGIDPDVQEPSPHRVIRGGGWDAFEVYAYSHYRGYRTPTAGFNDVGFRLVRDLEKFSGAKQ